MPRCKPRQIIGTIFPYQYHVTWFDHNDVIQKKAGIGLLLALNMCDCWIAQLRRSPLISFSEWKTKISSKYLESVTLILSKAHWCRWDPTFKDRTVLSVLHRRDNSWKLGSKRLFDLVCTRCKPIHTRSELQSIRFSLRYSMEWF